MEGLLILVAIAMMALIAVGVIIMVFNQSLIGGIVITVFLLVVVVGMKIARSTF